MAGPLAGVNVVSFGRYLSGPFAAMLMADLGAEVIKIEDRKGDPVRHNRPFVGDLSHYFLSVNRGKKSFSIDLRHPRTKAVLEELVKQTDILIENFRPGIMKKMGFDYEAAQKLNPRLIYLSISGFGQTGPYAYKPAYDMVAQGIGGTISITGMPESAPVRVGYSIGDMGAGLFGVVASLAALYERERSGEGQYVDLAMMDSQIALCENAFSRYFASGEVPKPLGSRHPIITPFQVFQTRTDYMVVIAAREEEWKKLCRVIGREDLMDDERFLTNDLRSKNHQVLESVFNDIFSAKPRDEWLALFDREGIVASPVNTIEQVAVDSHAQAREMILNVEHSRLGALKVVGTPMKFSRTPCEIKEAPPDLGEHTRDILRDDLKLSPEEIQELQDEAFI